jgi:hypothetical protein
LLTVVGQATTGKPCERWFLETLIKDLRRFIRILLLRYPYFDKFDGKFPYAALRPAKYILAIMNECRRLRAYPELFPTPSLRMKFLSKVACYTRNIPRLNAVLVKIAALESTARATNPCEQKPILARKVGNIWFKIRNPEVRKLSDLHPHVPGSKNQWNKWLDKFEGPYPGDDSPEVVRQRVPLVGIKLIRRQRFMYGVVRLDHIAVRKQQTDLKLFL